MPHPPGTRLGPYEVLSAVGSGGMGEVYKARDTRLERTVAVKVSKEAFGERFRNEALAIAALNHPHVCTLFDVGPDYLVMEFVEGKVLQGPLPVGEALRLGGQIADALEHAHRHGVVHLDLKPSNILATKGGVKVLDFGLAARRPEPGTEASQALTLEGTAAGTPAYMAPEQIEGRPADERTDIFAFGLVLYELLTGRRAFEGESAARVMAAILEHEPTPPSTLKPDLPPALEQVLMSCLAKDPNERWQSVRELKHALAWASRTDTTPHSGGRAGWIAAAIASAVAVAALALAVAGRRAAVEKPVATRFEVLLPPELNMNWYERPTVAPDGGRVVVAAHHEGQSHLYVRALGSIDLARVPGSEGASFPFWSPDGKRIGFVAEGKMKTVELSGGPTHVICGIEALSGASWNRETLMNTGFRGATWNRDGDIVFSSLGQLFRTSASGGAPTALAKPAKGETSRQWPQFLPDGRRYLYFSQGAPPQDDGVYVGALDSPERRRLGASDHDAAYSASGHLLFVKDGVILAQSFDAERVELSGEAVPVAEPVAVAKPPYRGAAYSASANGTVVWRTGFLSEQMQLTWFDRSGKELGTLGEPADYGSPALSPDGTRVAVERRDPQTQTRDLWVFDLAHGNSTRLTFDPANDVKPVWSPDGAWIAFSSDRGGVVRNLYRKRANGKGEDEVLLASPDDHKNLEDWSPDGRLLAFNYWRHPSGLYLLPLSPGQAPKPIFLLADAWRGRFAPGGRWLAYESDAVYVEGLSPDGARGEGKWQVSTTGGMEPHWRSDGRELFYLDGATLMAVDVKLDGASFESGQPRPLFKVSLPAQPRRTRYAVTRDGQRFLVNRLLEQGSEILEVLVNGLPERR